ncbi:hypothetical protein Cni_G06777 [Canna indica]|uniref:Transposase MuDR plant domain-containing protein n=1 Tax=Canna indica TaxID=4628 RepID=A0AAQ3JXP6_9LILI|nr:hypothetical protein Cni_G06777 [Canna indica]
MDEDSNYAPSDELLSIDRSDNSNSEPRRRNREFNMKIDMNRNVKLKAGQKFNSHISFRKALKEWSIQNARDYKFVKIEKAKIIAICKVKDCTWRIYASPDQDKGKFVVKRYKLNHQYGRQYHNRKVSSRWIALKYLENFCDSPNWEASSLKQAVQREHYVFKSDAKAYRAKSIALKIILGDEAKQFTKLRKYALAILKANPGMVEIENKETWRWFLELLLDDIGSVEHMCWTFMSDQQKGLIEVFKEIMPGVDHQFCVRHLHNFKNVGYKGKTLKDLMWNSARANTLAEHNLHMKEIEKLEVVEFQWLKKLKTRLWCR